jgi:hypothetical protein
MPSRRPILGAAASVLTAGCLGPVRSLTGSDDDCVSGFSVHAAPFQPSDQLPVQLSTGQRDLVDRMVQNGPTDFTTYAGDPPLRDGVYVTVDGTYYRTAIERTTTTDVPAHRLDITWEKGQEAPAEASVVAYGDLPEADQRVLRLAIEGPKAGAERHGHPSERLSLRDSPMPYPNGTDDSRLVNRAETWVRWNDRTYRVTSGDSATTTRYTYRYAASAVAESADGFRDHVAQQYLIRLADLSAAERTIIDQATADGYRECEPASEGLARLRERLPDGRRLPHPYDQEWFVEFERRRYELTITNWIR